MSNEHAEDPLEHSIVSTLAQRGVVDFVADAGEITLDQFLEDGVLREIPVVATAMRLYRAGVGVRNYLFIKKLLNFLKRLSDIPEAKREAFVDKLSRDQATARRVGESLLMLLDRFDDMEKPQLLARAFKAYMDDRIDFVTFRRLGLAIERVFTADLMQLPQIDSKAPLEGAVTWGLSSCGLIELFAAMPVGGPGAFSRWQRTRLGEIFIEVVLTPERAAA